MQVVQADLLLISGGLLLLILVSVVVTLIWIKRREKEQIQMARELKADKRRSGGIQVQDPSRPSTVDPAPEPKAEAEPASSESPKLDTEPGLKPAAKPAAMYAPKKGNVVTSKTREELDQMMGSVKSLSRELEQAPEVDVSDDEVKSKLQDSSLIQGLADTLITQVRTEEDKTGKFSKMMVEGHLLFEDELIDPEEEEK